MLSEEKRRATGGFVVILQLFLFSYLCGESYTSVRRRVLVLFSPVAGNLAHYLLFPQRRTQCVFFSYLFRLKKMRNRNIILYFSSF